MSTITVPGRPLVLITLYQMSLVKSEKLTLILYGIKFGMISHSRHVLIALFFSTV